MNRPFPFAFTLGAIAIVVLYYLFSSTEDTTQENVIKEEISSPISSSSSVGLIDDERIIPGLSLLLKINGLSIAPVVIITFFALIFQSL